MPQIYIDIVKTLLLPSLEILANAEHQHTSWVKNHDTIFWDPYNDCLEDFFEICKSLLSLSEEDKLDEKHRRSLEELYKMVKEFHSAWGCELSDNLQEIISHPEWVKIQKKSCKLLEELKPIVKAREFWVIDINLIPLLEILVDRNYQEKLWLHAQDSDAYSYWFTEFAEVCDFLLKPEQNDKLDEKNKKALEELYQLVDEFDDTLGRQLAENIPALIRHPKWIKIQLKAEKLLKALKKEKKV